MGQKTASLVELERLHAEIDAAAGSLARRHAGPLQCRHGCRDCCKDEITVFRVEAERIRRNRIALLENERPARPGGCAFLDGEGGCRIYEDRPYVCRTQGLPLRWLDDDDQGRRVEWRDICPLNDLPDQPIERLPAEDCWTLGEYEGRLARLQQSFDDGAMLRVRLRDLFRSVEIDDD